MWFTDENVFAVEPLFNSQTDRPYVKVGTKKRNIIATHAIKSVAGYTFIFQQDSTSMAQLLQCATSDFTARDLGPLNRPDLS